MFQKLPYCLSFSLFHDADFSFLFDGRVGIFAGKLFSGFCVHAEHPRAPSLYGSAGCTAYKSSFNDIRSSRAGRILRRRILVSFFRILDDYRGLCRRSRSLVSQLVWKTSNF